MCSGRSGYSWLECSCSALMSVRDNLFCPIVCSRGILMKAIVNTHYGSPDVLQLKEVEKPAPSDHEVLVKVLAASAAAGDWHLLRAEPFLFRLTAGLLKPKHKILGADVAGRVEAVGGNVKQFQPGDAVFGNLSGCGFGGFAEYVAVPENALVLKPTNLT